MQVVNGAVKGLVTFQHQVRPLFEAVDEGGNFRQQQRTRDPESRIHQTRIREK